MKKTFQSFVFGCRVNEAERIKLDRELIAAGYSLDLASPGYIIINTCAITGKAEREAKQLIYQLRRQHPQAQIVLTGCSSTLWSKYQTSEEKLANLIVPNDKKSSLVSLLEATEMSEAKGATSKVAGLANTNAFSVSTKIAYSNKLQKSQPQSTGPVDWAQNDKFRYSNRLLVKIQDGCQRFCSYCIVPYLRGLPRSQKIAEIVSYINSFNPVPSEVVLCAINTEAFGTDTGESLVDLIKHVLADTAVPRIAFGSIHPWSLTDEFIDYYRTTLFQEKRFVQFFHVPIQSGSQTMLEVMKREYQIKDVMHKLKEIQSINSNALIATDVIVGFLGETDALFEESYSRIEASPISRLHVFRFSNRPHTAAYYLRKQMKEPSPEQKKKWSNFLLSLSKKKYQQFLTTQVGRSADALVIAPYKNKVKVLLDNHIEGILHSDKECLPGSVRHVTIIAAKDGIVTCQDS